MSVSGTRAMAARTSVARMAASTTHWAEVSRRSMPSTTTVWKRPRANAAGLAPVASLGAGTADKGGHAAITSGSVAASTHVQHNTWGGAGEQVVFVIVEADRRI